MGQVKVKPQMVGFCDLVGTGIAPVKKKLLLKHFSSNLTSKSGTTHGNTKEKLSVEELHTDH